ncbi:hypothetical protein H4R33_001526 [Dimargaris cristalligena]|nr:hypothetical protein H4R33_001526 [Dimargaris cristalligena]
MSFKNRRELMPAQSRIVHPMSDEAVGTDNSRQPGEVLGCSGHPTHPLHPG